MLQDHQPEFKTTKQNEQVCWFGWNTRIDWFCCFNSTISAFHRWNHTWNQPLCAALSKTGHLKISFWQTQLDCQVGSPISGQTGASQTNENSSYYGWCWCWFASSLCFALPNQCFASIVFLSDSEGDAPFLVNWVPNHVGDKLINIISHDMPFISPAPVLGFWCFVFYFWIFQWFPPVLVNPPNHRHMFRMVVWCLHNFRGSNFSILWNHSIRGENVWFNRCNFCPNSPKPLWIFINFQ